MKEVTNILGADAKCTPEMACTLAEKMMLRNPRYDEKTDEIVIETHHLLLLRRLQFDLALRQGHHPIHCDTKDRL